MGLNFDSYKAALKSYYTKNRLTNMVLKDKPLLDVLTKDTNGGGSDFKVPVQFADPAGRSRTFSDAQTTAGTSGSSTQLATFTVGYQEDYAVARVSSKAIKTSKNNNVALMEATKVEVAGIVNRMSLNLARGLFDDGFCSIGQINSTVTGTTLTLKDSAKIINFTNGQRLCFAQTASSGALRKTAGGAVAVVQVASVNESAGSMTLDVDLNTVVSLADGDAIFVVGDRADTASPAARGICGLPAWCPIAVPASTAFNGVDRTTHYLLYGIPFDARNKQPDVAFKQACTLSWRRGGKVDLVVCDPLKWLELSQVFDDKVRYGNIEGTLRTGIKTIKLIGPQGEYDVMADPFCPPDRAYGLTTEHWKLVSAGPLIQPASETNAGLLPSSSEAGIEIRYESFLNLGCFAPGYQVAMQVTPATV